MKKVIVIIFPILLVGQDPNMSENIQNIINQAKDYYDVSLLQRTLIAILEPILLNKYRNSLTRLFNFIQN